MADRPVIKFQHMLEAILNVDQFGKLALRMSQESSDAIHSYGDARWPGAFRYPIEIDNALQFGQVVAVRYLESDATRPNHVSESA